MAKVPEANVRLVKGNTGDFEVTVGGVLKFSKQELRRFPTDEETVGLVSG